MSRHAESPTRLIALNTAIQFIGKLLVMLLGLGAIALLTRYLGVSGFGQFTTVFAFVSFLAVFADFGFFAVLVTQLAQGKGNPSRVTSNIMTLRALVALAVYLIGFAISFLLPYPDAVKLGIGVIAAAWFGQSLNQTLVGVFQVNQAMAKPVLADLVGKAAVLGLVFAAVQLQASFHLILASYTIGALLTLILNLWFVRSFVAVVPAFDLGYWRKVIDLALPMAAVLVLGFIYFKADTVILSVMKGAKDVGIYGVPYKLVEVLLVFPSIFMGTVLPYLTRYLAQGDPKIAGAFAKAFHFLFLLGLPVLLVGNVLSQPLVELLGGREFIGATTVTLNGAPIGATVALQILLVAVFLSYLSHLTTYMVVAVGKQKDLVVPNLLFAVVNIGLNVAFIPRYSYLAAAVITVLTELAVLLTSYAIIWLKIGKLLPDIRYLGKVVLVNLALLALIWPLRAIALPWLLVIAITAYGALVVGARLISRQELVQVLQLRRRGGVSATA